MKFLNCLERTTAGRMARDHALTYLDVGARGGFQPDLAALAFAVRAVGAEPHPDAVATLNGGAGPWLETTVLPVAVGAEGGRRTLHVPADADGASLLARDAAIGRRFAKQQFFDPVTTLEVDTVTLDEAVARAGLDRVDYLKLDVEGPELAILQSAPDLVDTTLAIRTEVAFLPLAPGQGTAADMDQFLLGRGFELMELAGAAHWRLRSVHAAPYLDAGPVPYARGQLVHGDYLFLRRANTLAADDDRRVRLALVAMALGYFDHALEALDTESMTSRLIDTYGAAPERMVDEASRRYGRIAYRQALAARLRGAWSLLRHLPAAWRL